ncbi:hypothetical protein E4K10_47905 [Streptomyces sp. T1317-0309]|nr:hypothetical protein E4K10_47905 [Streptomyces sp. T1317-0309]
MPTATPGKSRREPAEGLGRKRPSPCGFPTSGVQDSANSRASDRTAQKIRRQEQGHEYAAAQLVALGAPPPRASCDPAVWLRDALVAVGARNIRHRGRTGSADGCRVLPSADDATRRRARRPGRERVPARFQPRRGRREGIPARPPSYPARIYPRWSRSG